MITEITLDTDNHTELCSNLQTILDVFNSPELQDSCATELMDGSWKIGNAIVDVK
jgi:hypothetical protein